MKKTLILFIAAVMFAAALAGCSGNSGSGGTAPGPSSSAPDQSVVESGSSGAESESESSYVGLPTAHPADFGWIRVDLPETFAETGESSQYLTLADSQNGKRFIRVAYDHLMDRPIEQIANEQAASNPGKYSKGADGFFAGLSWQVLNFVDNGLDSRMFFADAGDGAHFVRVTAFGMTENDFELQIIMSSIVLDTGKM